MTLKIYGFSVLDVKNDIKLQLIKSSALSPRAWRGFITTSVVELADSTLAQTTRPLDYPDKMPTGTIVIDVKKNVLNSEYLD